MAFLSLFSLILMLTDIDAASTFKRNNAFVVVESIASTPARFVSGGPTPSDVVLDLRISLKQSDTSGLEETLLTISDPQNPQYGAWLSREEIAAYVQPTTETYSLVESWLVENGVMGMTNASFAGDWVRVSIPVSQANEMLDAQFETYVDATTGVEAIRTLAYSIPTALEGHVNLIHPTVNFPIHRPTSQMKKRNTSPTDVAEITLPSSCLTTTTPACIQELYGLPTALVANPSKLSIWIPEYEAIWPDSEDLGTFLSLYRPDISDPYPAGVVNFTVLTLDNATFGNNVMDSGFEASLDFEVAAGVASGVPLTLVTTGPADVATYAQLVELFLDSALFMAGVEDVPTVITTSYGADERNVTLPLAQAVCDTFMQLGARGSSVIFASGDGGVAGNSGSLCDEEPFIPVFPSTCPYVTSVGGTQLNSNPTEEVAVNLNDYFWAVSGGFSNYFPRPAYQDVAVPPYFEYLGETYAGRYNASGRGFPDVSAIAVNFPLEWADSPFPGGASGTSMSAPTFASIVALLNDARISAGRPALGFLNPLLYLVGGAGFTDILEGNNPGCATNGFNVTAGWDPVTGLGTPIFSQLLDIVLSPAEQT